MGRRQANHVSVDPANPQAAAQCDLCGRWWNLRTLRMQKIWAGNMLYEFNSLRCVECYDIPNEQLRTIILPPDPPPMLNSRVPNFSLEEYTNMVIQFGGGDNQPFPQNEAYGAGPAAGMVLQDGAPMVLQLITSSMGGGVGED
jgi:hypothetical protein